VTRPVLFVTNHAPAFRIGAFRELHEREDAVFALIGGAVRHGGGAGDGELPFPVLRPSQRGVLRLAASGRYRAVVAGLSGRVALPAVIPYYLTGAITASGGSWNAAIVAELVTWGKTQVKAHGLGAYIAEATVAGDYHRIVLGIATMSVFVVAINRFFWRPLYYYAERKFRLG